MAQHFYLGVAVDVIYPNPVFLFLKEENDKLL